MIINCIIVDDEPLARKGLKEYVTDVDFLKLVGEFENPLKATELISSGDVQLLFLDIQMPKITGLDFFRTLQNAPPVIFTTAYPQYALEGFEVNALDYLIKPISFDRFLKAAMKAREYYEVRETNEKEKATTDYFFIKTDNKLVKILFEDVLFVEALQNYVKVHKSYIVCPSKVDSIEGNDIRIGQQHIPISRNQKDEVMEKLLKGKFLKR